MARKPNQELALISIHPEFVEKIFSGKKLVEFRKRISSNINFFLIYATAPVSCVVGYFEASKFHNGKPEYLWRKFSKVAGIDKRRFLQYFADKKVGIAIEIKHPIKFLKPLPLKDVMGEIRPPQSFLYIDGNTTFEKFKKRITSIGK